jgi:hypothetical protein
VEIEKVAIIPTCQFKDKGSACQFFVSEKQKKQDGGSEASFHCDIQMNTHTYMCIYTHTHTQTHARTHTHTHTHAHTLVWSGLVCSLLVCSVLSECLSVCRTACLSVRIPLNFHMVSTAFLGRRSISQAIYKKFFKCDILCQVDPVTVGRNFTNPGCNSSWMTQRAFGVWL